MRSTIAVTCRRVVSRRAIATPDPSSRMSDSSVPPRTKPSIGASWRSGPAISISRSRLTARAMPARSSEAWIPSISACSTGSGVTRSNPEQEKTAG